MIGSQFSGISLLGDYSSISSYLDTPFITIYQLLSTAMSTDGYIVDVRLTQNGKPRRTFDTASPVLPISILQSRTSNVSSGQCTIERGLAVHK